MKKILIINGSMTGSTGNTQKIVNLAIEYLKEMQCEIKIHNIDSDLITLKNNLAWADAMVMATGTYWDSWSSHFQKFIEDLTNFEASEEILFKPVSTIVSMHAFGGKEVMSRLQGILNTMGFMIPPMSGFVYGLAIHEALNQDEDFAKDFWSLDDLEIVMHNLVTSLENKPQYKAWPVDKKDPKRIWLNI